MHFMPQILYDPRGVFTTHSYAPISKNVVGENGEWQLSNGNCTTARNSGFHIWYAKTISSSRGAKLGSSSNHDEDGGNKNHTNLHIWQWKTVFLHALHGIFHLFTFFEDVLVLSMTWNDLFCSCVDNVTWAYDSKCWILSCPKRWFQFNSRIVNLHCSGIITLIIERWLQKR